MTTATPPPKSARIRLTRRSAAYWRVTIDNPPINVMSPEMIGQSAAIRPRPMSTSTAPCPMSN
jgi:hypothetical protein